MALERWRSLSTSVVIPALARGDALDPAPAGMGMGMGMGVGWCCLGCLTARRRAAAEQAEARVEAAAAAVTETERLVLEVSGSATRTQMLPALREIADAFDAHVAGATDADVRLMCGWLAMQLLALGATEAAAPDARPRARATRLVAALRGLGA